MKKNQLIIITLLIVGLMIQCQKLDELTMFDLEYTTTVQVPASAGIALPLDIFSPEVTTQAETEFAFHDTEAELVEEITLDQMTLTITAPNDQRFDFLKSIEVFINADSLSELRIAYQEDVPANVGAELDLTTVQNNLREYLLKDRFSLRVEVVTDEFITNDVAIDVYSKYHVDAKVLGL